MPSNFINKINPIQQLCDELKMLTYIDEDHKNVLQLQKAQIRHSGLFISDWDTKEITLKGLKRSATCKISITAIFETVSQLQFNMKYADSWVIYSIQRDITAGLSRPFIVNIKWKIWRPNEDNLKRIFMVFCHDSTTQKRNMIVFNSHLFILPISLLYLNQL